MGGESRPFFLREKRDALQDNHLTKRVGCGIIYMPLAPGFASVLFVSERMCKKHHPMILVFRREPIINRSETIRKGRCLEHVRSN